MIRPTSEKAAEYLWFGKQCLDLQSEGASAIVDGLYTIICKYTPEDAILIAIGGGSFIATPRLLGQNNGYSEALKPQGAGSLTYPLDDLTDTSQVLTIGDKEFELDRSAHLYGNIDWIGPNSLELPESDAIVLTWKGPTGRLVAFDYTKPISGLTTSDITFSEDEPPKYTCFGPNIYSEGQVYDTIPTTGDVLPKVLGCAIQNGVLVCIVNNHYPGRIGFFEEVWIGGEKVYERVVGRPSLIWAFNQSGTKATQWVSEYSIDVENKTVTYDAGTNTSISYLLKAEMSGAHSTEYSGETKVWSDYKGDERVFAVVKASGGHRFIPSIVDEATDHQATKYYLGTLGATVSVSISGGQATATITGTHCPCTGVWTISSGTITQSGGIDLDSGCGMATVTYTCGDLSATAQVKMNNGRWVRTEYIVDSRWSRESYYQEMFYYPSGATTEQPGDTFYVNNYYNSGVATAAFIPVYDWSDATQSCSYYTILGSQTCLPNIVSPVCPACSPPVGGGTTVNEPHGCFSHTTPVCWGCKTHMAYTWGCVGDVDVSQTTL